MTWVHLVGAKWLLVASSDCSLSSLALLSVPDVLRGEAPLPVAEAYLDAAVRNGELEVQQDGFKKR